MSPSSLEYLRYILDELEYLSLRGQGLSKDQFLEDSTLQRAFVRSLEIVGEAAKKVPVEFKQKYGHIDWRAIAGMRDRLIHDYFGVDYDIVWDVVKNKAPILQKELQEIIEKENR